MSSSPAIKAYWDTARRLLDSRAYHATVADAAALLARAYSRGGIVVTLGDGGFANTASHFAADLARHATHDRADFRVACLNDGALAARLDENTWGAYCERSTGTWLREGGGVFCAFSLRGGGVRDDRPGARHLVRAASTAQALGNRLIAFTGFDGGKLGELADVHVNVPIDEEPIATPLTASLHLVAQQAICLALRTGMTDPTPTPMTGRSIHVAA